MNNETKKILAVCFMSKRMRRLLGLVLMIVLSFSLQTIVLATDAGSDGNVLTIDTSLNVEPPGADGDNDSYSPNDTSFGNETIPWAWHPISVVNEPMNGFNSIRKTYALPPYVNPAVILTDDLEIFGQKFSFAYVIQQTTYNESFKEMRQTVTIETRSRDLSDILPNLEQEIWFERDGFAGILVLDIHSITSEAAGTSRHTGTATRQRTFPHLSSPDNSLIPRNITDGGTTFYLSNVDWQSVSLSAIDGIPVAAGYTAHATFTAQVTQTRTTGYTITAEYVGTVFRTVQGMTLFTAVFYGEPINEIWPDESDLASDSDSDSDLGHGAGADTDSIPGSIDSSADGPGLEATHPTQSPQPREVGETDSIGSTILIIAGTLFTLGVFGMGGYFLTKHFFGHNVTIYGINGPREIVKAGKIKVEPNAPEPTIVLDNIISRSPAKTDRYIVQIPKRSAAKLAHKDLRVVLGDKEAIHRVPESALETTIYEFEVNFSDDEPGGDGLGGV